MAHCGITTVLNGAIILDVANRTVAAILDRAITFNMTYGRIAAVLDGTVNLDIADCAVAAILNLLCIS